MLFKSNVVFMFLICFVYSGMAEITQAESFAKMKAKAKIESISKEKIRDYYNTYQKRVPKKITPPKHSNQKKSDIIDQNRLNKATNPCPIPAGMVFPGEFEEVQALLISWPYTFFDSTGTYQASQMFKNIGYVYQDLPDSLTDFLDSLRNDSINVSEDKYYDILDSLYKKYFGEYYNYLQKIVSQPDISDSSDLATLFSQLAKAIDDNAGVWIRIENASDSIEIKNFLSKKGIRLSRAKYLVYPGNAFWARDYGPVAFYYGPQDSIGFIDFEYYGGRQLDDSISVYMGHSLGYPVFSNSLEFEGGNIIVDGCGNLFTSDAIDSTNADSSGIDVFDGIADGRYMMHSIQNKKPLTAKQVRDSLKTFLNLNKFLILPAFQFDGGTGHIDLYADLWDENNFVFSQMPSQMSTLADYSIGQKNISDIMAFRKSDGTGYRKNYVPFPRKDDGSWYVDDTDYSAYTRTYSNHVFVNKTIIQPVFANRESGDYVNFQKDLDSLKLIYPGYKIVPICSNFLDGMGGSIHCITKQIPVSNPVRIIHLPVEVNTAYKTSYPINVKAFNKSGITKTVCKWRYSGESSWSTVQLSATNASVFSGAIANNRNSGSIEYYIEATSNNGKTMAKPITAPEGFYKFTFGGATDVVDLNAEWNNENVTFIHKPSMKRIYIKLPQFKSDFSIQLFDVSGKSVYTYKSIDASTASTANSIEINTASINPGTFIAVVQSKDGFVLNKKLMIAK